MGAFDIPQRCSDADARPLQSVSFHDDVERLRARGCKCPLMAGEDGHARPLSIGSGCTPCPIDEHNPDPNPDPNPDTQESAACGPSVV